MSTFKHKLSELKEKINNQQATHEQPQSIQIVKQCTNHHHKKQELSFQHPIFIQRKTSTKYENHVKKTKNVEIQVRKKVQPWVPINIPPRQKKMDVENIQMNQPSSSGNKEIQIQIENDDKNKDCLKKLFKKIKKLQDQLKQSQKQRMRLVGKLQAQNYKLSIDVEHLKKLLKDKDDQIARLNSRAPKQTVKEIIKEVIVQKPVEVIVEVPKFVPGPERIVEKIVQVPKYIEVQKTVTVQVPREVIKQVVRTVQIPVPTIVEKPVYIQKPVYIDRIVEKIVQVPVNVPVQVPVEYPVYIQKPVIQQQWLNKMRQLQLSYESSLKEKLMLSSQNEELRIRVNQLASNLQILRYHNEEKNREVEYLFQNNSLDFIPISPNQHHHYHQDQSFHNQDRSIGSVKYSISSKAHPRII